VPDDILRIVVSRDRKEGGGVRVKLS
jgi:hypothetical protein